jgi:hypothetical protein
MVCTTPSIIFLLFTYLFIYLFIYLFGRKYAGLTAVLKGVVDMQFERQYSDSSTDSHPCCCRITTAAAEPLINPARRRPEIQTLKRVV